MRRVNFENNKYYHIYNRWVDKRDIFCDEKDFVRFIISMREFNCVEPIGSLYMKSKRIERGPTPSVGVGPLTSPLVQIICYCLNPNHYNIVLKQLTDNGISNFMKRIGVGYTCYFNLRYNRSGSLFQGKFKAKHIDTAKYLAWLSAYVNGNPEIHKISKAKNYKWSSHRDYLSLRNGTLSNKETVLCEFNSNLKEYEEFVNVVINDSCDKKENIKEYSINLES